ncbi:MAG: PAS domain-containing sensor histidine kinase [Planctomycetota bacterium]
MDTSEQRYRLLFDDNLAGVYRTTLAGVILDCNESMAAMLGYGSREELMSHRAWELYFEPGDREGFLGRLEDGGALTNAELCLRRKDGTPIHILENVSLVPDEEGALTIIQGTMVDITERKRAEEGLRASEQRHRDLTEELRLLMQRLQAVREEEGARIARELHDELGQALTALNMDLHWLRGRSWHQSQGTLARISSMCELLGTTIHSVRRICADLRPTVLEDFGLSGAVEWQAREFQSRTGIRCDVSLPEERLSVPREQAIAVFRIFQESLTNIARHARATLAEVSLQVNSQTLVLTVCDDGVGIAEEELSSSGSLGLVGMRERALGWGGELEISGSPAKGTTVILRMPAQQRGAEHEP